MALAPAPLAGGRGAFFAVFWRFSAVFDPIWEGTRHLSGYVSPASRAAHHGPVPVAGQLVPVSWCRLPVSWCRSAGAGCRLPVLVGIKSR